VIQKFLEILGNVIEGIVKVTGRKGFGHLLVQLLLTMAFAYAVHKDTSGTISGLFQAYCFTSAGNFAVFAGANAVVNATTSKSKDAAKDPPTD
jgi:hypothetical protein